MPHRAPPSARPRWTGWRPPPGGSGTDHRLTWSVLARLGKSADRRQKAIVCPTSNQVTRVRDQVQPASTNRPASAIIPQVPSAGTDSTVGAGAVTVTLTEMSPEFRALAPSLFLPRAWMVNVSVPENPAAGV